MSNLSRVLMCCASPFPPRDGIGFYVWNLAQALTAVGVQVTVLTRARGPFRKERKLEGMGLIEAPFLPLYPFHLALHRWWLAAELRRLTPHHDLVHVHSPVVPWVELGPPCLVTFHSALRHDAECTPGFDLPSLAVRLQTRISALEEERWLASAVGVAAVSGQVAEVLGSYRNAPRAVRVVGNGVNLDEFEYGGGERPLDLFLTVSRLVPGKGVEEVLEAARLLPDRRFLIAGEGSLEGRLRRRARGLHNLEFLGQIRTRPALSALYRNVTALLVPSYHEGLPTVILEAMASGCPVLATTVGGIPELIQNRVSGRLFAPRSVPELVRAVQEYEPGQGRLWAERAVRSVRERYSWSALAQNHLKLYGELTEGGIPLGL